MKTAAGLRAEVLLTSPACSPGADKSPVSRYASVAMGSESSESTYADSLVDTCACSAVNPRATLRTHPTCLRVAVRRYMAARSRSTSTRRARAARRRIFKVCARTQIRICKYFHCALARSWSTANASSPHRTMIRGVLCRPFVSVHSRRGAGPGRDEGFVLNCSGRRPGP